MSLRHVALAAIAVASWGVIAAGSALASNDVVGEPLPSPTRTWDAVAGRFDHSGGRDILLTRHQSLDGGFFGGLYLNDGPGSWALAFAFPDADRHGCDAGDVNSDGRLDFYCEVGADRGLGSGENELWIQVGNGLFDNRAAAWGVVDPLGRGRRPLMYDRNGDGRLDLYTTSAERPDGAHPGNRLYINVGGRFVEKVTPVTGNRGYRCVDNGDFNGDGRQDLVVCAGGSAMKLFRNLGATDDEVSSALGASISSARDAQLADVNGDGLDDLVVVLADQVQIRINQGSGRRFSQIARSVPLVDGQRALIADMTGDGIRDIYVTTGCDALGRNAPDKLLVGPAKAPFTPPGDPAGGCGNEVVNAGKLVVFNGDTDSVGPVSVRSYPFSPPAS